jgi:hypothetical protein
MGAVVTRHAIQHLGQIERSQVSAGGNRCMAGRAVEMLFQMRSMGKTEIGILSRDLRGRLVGLMAPATIFRFRVSG